MNTSAFKSVRVSHSPHFTGCYQVEIEDSATFHAVYEDLHKGAQGTHCGIPAAEIIGAVDAFLRAEAEVKGLGVRSITVKAPVDGRADLLSRLLTELHDALGVPRSGLVEDQNDLALSIVRARAQEVVDLSVWREVALKVDAQWRDVQEAVCGHPSTTMGDSVSVAALRLIEERDTFERQAKQQADAAQGYFDFFMRILDAAGTPCGLTNTTSCAEVVSAIEKVFRVAKVLDIRSTDPLSVVVDTLAGLVPRMREECLGLIQENGRLKNCVNEETERWKAKYHELVDSMAQYTQAPAPAAPRSFLSELQILINQHSLENGSDTPDFILAGFLNDALQAFDLATCDRDRHRKG